MRGTLEEFSEAGIARQDHLGDNPKTVVALATQAGVHSLRRREGVDSYCDMVNAQTASAATTAGGAETGAGGAETGGAEAGGAAGPGEAAAAAPPADRVLVAVSGAELAELSPEDFAATADEAGIFGRVTPEQKQDLVEALRDRGRYVAMIGDGVNDVIALKQANVAVAMQGGSQAARSVGDLILMKDTFAPLPFAFREGQRIINGMNDILRIFMVRIGFKALMIAIIMTAGGFPFAPRQSALLSFFGATPCRPSPSRSGRSRARRPRSGCSSCWRASSCPPSCSWQGSGRPCTSSGPSRPSPSSGRRPAPPRRNWPPPATRRR